MERSPLAPEQPPIPLSFAEQLPCDGPILIEQFVECDVDIRLGFVRNALQRIGDFCRDFLFAARCSGDADVDVGYGASLQF